MFKVCRLTATSKVDLLNTWWHQNIKYDSVKASTWRPKTLNRDHILAVAMNSYWDEGIDGVSLNEISKKAKVAKPGLYRESEMKMG